MKSQGSDSNLATLRTNPTLSGLTVLLPQGDFKNFLVGKPVLLHPKASGQAGGWV